MYDTYDLSNLIKKNKFNGSVLISHKNEVILAEGYGLACFEHSIPNTPNTVMRIASITKTITAVAVLKLSEIGQLNLKDKVSDYLKDFQYKEITIHHLLSNSSGVAGFDLSMDFYDVLNSKDVLKSLIDVFKDKPLEIKTGAEFRYSVSGYLILQYIIESVTKMSYFDYLKDAIFNVLKMDNTYFEYPMDIIPNRATPYSNIKGEIKKAVYIDMRIAGAGGALISNINDLYKFNNALLKNKIITEKSSKLIFGNQVMINEDNYYGYGMINSIYNSFGVKRRVHYHSGGGPGVRTYNAFLPDDDLQVIILSNVDDKEVFESTREIIEKFLLQS